MPNWLIGLVCAAVVTAGVAGGYNVYKQMTQVPPAVIEQQVVAGKAPVVNNESTQETQESKTDRIAKEAIEKARASSKPENKDEVKETSSIQSKNTNTKKNVSEDKVEKPIKQEDAATRNEISENEVPDTAVKEVQDIESSKDDGKVTEETVYNTVFTIVDSDDQEMYASTALNVRDLPSIEGRVVNQLKQNEKVTVTGYVESYKGEPCLWYQIGYNQFVNAAYLNDKPVAVQQTAAKKKSTKKNTQQQTDAAAQAAAAQKAAQAAAAQKAAQQAAAAAAAAAAQQAAQQQEYYEYYEYEDGGVIIEGSEGGDWKDVSSGGHPGEVY